MTTTDWILLAVVALSAGLGMMRGFIGVLAIILLPVCIPALVKYLFSKRK